MESASLARWKWANALRGTALLIAEVATVFCDEVVELAGDNAFVGGMRTPDEGVYGAEVVIAFDPAEEDPDDEKELAAPGPDVPDEALAWIYKSCSTLGSCWYCGRASSTTWYWLS